MGNTCLMAQLSMAERNTAGARRKVGMPLFALQDRYVHAGKCCQHEFVAAPHSSRFVPEKLMVYVALSGNPQGRSASGSTMPALAATSCIWIHNIVPPVMSLLQVLQGFPTLFVGWQGNSGLMHRQWRRLPTGG
jgi:hypothetical protein